MILLLVSDGDVQCSVHACVIVCACGQAGGQAGGAGWVGRWAGGRVSLLDCRPAILPAVRVYGCVSVCQVCLALVRVSLSGVYGAPSPLYADLPYHSKEFRDTGGSHQATPSTTYRKDQHKWKSFFPGGTNGWQKKAFPWVMREDVRSFSLFVWVRHRHCIAFFPRS